MSDNSFDIVSKIDMQEVLNAVLQAEKEVANRFDLKKANAIVRMEGDEIFSEAADEYNLNQALDVVKGKLVRRGVDLKALRPGKLEDSKGSRVRQKIAFQQGIPQETAKKIVAEIKAMKAKVQASIQGDTVRVAAKKRDDLQEVIAKLKSLEWDLPLSFTNYRSP